MPSLSDSQNIDLGPAGGPVLPAGSPLQVCAACEALLDISEREPLERVACPQCGAELTITGQVAHYQIVEVAGRGGMGVVYKAYDPSLDRHVAIKLLRKEQSSDRKLIKQLETEAAITASVTDPNVVRVYGSGFDRGRFYVAMELVDKGSLDSLIQLQGRVAEAQVLEVGAQIAKGLRAAHQHGLIHRDVKPGNILFADAHTAKIVDFGLAVFQSQEESVRGEIWGTPYYVAPEKLDQQPEDFRSDMYSLGGTLFHALAGRPPFEAENASLVALKHLKSQQVSLQSFAPWVSNGTAHIINRMLAKDPGQRFQSYEELIESLEYALTQLHAQGGANAARTRVKIEDEADQKRWTWVFLVLAAVLVVIGAGVAISVLKKPAPVGKAAVQAAVRTGPRYEPLQDAIEALAAGKKEAVDLFEQAAGNAALSPADRAWAKVFAGASMFANGRVSEARATFAQIDEMAANVKDESMAGLLTRIGRFGSDTKPVPAEVTARLDTTGHEAAALLVFALHDWHAGKTGEATALFKQFRSAEPSRTAEWIGQFKPLAVQFIEKETAFAVGMNRLGAATNGSERSSAADALRKVDPAFKARADAAIEPFKAEIAKYKADIAKPPTGGIFRIANRAHGKVLDVSGRNMAAGAKVATYDAGTATNQWWRFLPLGQDKVKLVAMHSGKLLTAEGGAGGADAKIVQADDKDLPAQKWQIISKGDGWFKLRNEGTGKFLTPATDTRDNGVLLVARADDDKAPLYQWRFDRMASPVGEFAGHQVGGGKGGFAFKDGGYTVRNAGRDIWGNSDNFGFAFREITGDFELVARVVEVTTPQPGYKAGLIVRAGLGGDEPGVAALMTSGDRFGHQGRLKKGTPTSEVKTPKQPLPHWLKLVRAGGQITSYHSADGTAWQEAGSEKIEGLKPAVFAGLAVCSHDVGKEIGVRFDEVKLTPR
ncbi:MAG: protein kinase [Chthoniobacteraceae bacterium]